MNQEDEVFVRNFGLMLVGLVVIAIMASVIAKAVDRGYLETQGRGAVAAARIAPVGQVNIGAEPIVLAANAPQILPPAMPATAPTESAGGASTAASVTSHAASAAELASAEDSAHHVASANDGNGEGKEIYDSACFVCHTPGAAGAPKFGDADAWRPRIEKGIGTLYTHSLNGFMGEVGMMPPKGGRPDFSNDAVKAAVDYIVSNAQ